ncbi:nucleoside triphosphate pyrophosphohydrolase [Dendrosporobacter sp. 1207_IL3150]|uniref:nucleoside triphosphate pyrophosphohydrolase n=1 Tax=Dendrosporobacter sp. 1207_IL3150 TaxID=3084054 RepID=UPI002FDB7DC2
MAGEVIHNKLVRDKILDIIESHGKQYSYHIAKEKEYQQFLIEKLREELLEFSQTPNEEEAADMLEVIFSLFHTFNLDPTRVEEIRQKKLAERGGFEKRIILEKVSG